MGFGHLDAELLGGGFDVVEGLFAFGVGDVLDLVEAGDGVADVGGVVERLLALFGEGVGGVGHAGCALRCRGCWGCRVSGIWIVDAMSGPLFRGRLRDGAVEGLDAA